MPRWVVIYDLEDDEELIEPDFISQDYDMTDTRYTLALPNEENQELTGSPMIFLRRLEDGEHYRIQLDNDAYPIIYRWNNEDVRNYWECRNEYDNRLYNDEVNYEVQANGEHSADEEETVAEEDSDIGDLMVNTEYTTMSYGQSVGEPEASEPIRIPREEEFEDVVI